MADPLAYTDVGARAAPAFRVFRDILKRGWSLAREARVVHRRPACHPRAVVSPTSRQDSHALGLTAPHVLTAWTIRRSLYYPDEEVRLGSAPDGPMPTADRCEHPHRYYGCRSGGQTDPACAQKRPPCQGIAAGRSVERCLRILVLVTKRTADGNWLHNCIIAIGHA